MTSAQIYPSSKIKMTLIGSTKEACLGPCREYVQDEFRAYLVVSFDASSAREKNECL